MARIFQDASYRKKVLALLGLGLLMFSGYAIALRGRKLQPRKAISLLGERVLTADSAASFRLVGFDLKWERPLAIECVELVLTRQPAGRAVLLREYPDRSICHLNVRIPDWSPGPALLSALVESDLGSAKLEAEVLIDPRRTESLEMVPPSVVLERQPVLLRQGPPVLGSESGVFSREREPSRMVFFPAGGRLSSTFSTRTLVRVLDEKNRPVSGRLEIGSRTGKQEAQADEDGFLELLVSEGRNKLDLEFQSDKGTLGGQVALVQSPTQVDAVVADKFQVAGSRVMVQIRALSESTTAYLDAWWRKGWFLSAEAEIASGNASVPLELPAGISGPAVVRARLDPFGKGPAFRDAAFLVGNRARPDLAQGWSMIRDLDTGENFWAEIGSLGEGTGRSGLLAVLSRVSPPEGLLPLLADGQEAEQQAVKRRKRDMVLFGLWMGGLVSLIAWLTVVWYLVAAWMATPSANRKGAGRAAWLGAAVVAFALGGGWLWLWWISRGTIG